MRRITFFIVAGVFLAACLLLYNSLDATSSRRKEHYESGRKQVEELERKLKLLEADLDKNQQLISQIRNNIYRLVGSKADATAASQLENLVITSHSHVAEAPKINDVFADKNLMCLNVHEVKKTDVQMLDVYDLLAFDNPDGGAWKQGWDITYSKHDVEQKQPQLLVYVIPHSHTDPGWIKTFERYYDDQTKHILDGMLKKLTEEPRMKFIYAEMSFFERWWKEIDESQRSSVKDLIKRGQFEIVTGAWVMTDEANSHYFSTVDQMIEGHQWLLNNLNYRPRHHWSIDPFGQSPTMAYLLMSSNFTTMLIQRIHYSVKKYLAQNRHLEFMWRQLWDSNKETDIFTHMMPFYSYDVPHTCGPDPKICCQFDFRRLPGSTVTCPWNVPPQEITESNVAERAFMLVDQYRKKAQLYKTNVLLVPLGDDFRYDTTKEWDDQFNNYQKLFDYMNAKSKWNVKAQFGTLGDYFSALHSRVKVPEGSEVPDFPVLSGDFFTYADRDDHYWSGYYTSRPLHKRMDRVVQHYLRGAEIIYSLSLAYMQKHAAVGYPFEELFSKLVEARRFHGIFQHHDGVTGTAKDHVVMDYGQKLAQAIKNCMAVIHASSHFLVSSEKATIHLNVDNLSFNSAESRVAADSLPDKDVIHIGEFPRRVVVYNSLPYEREEVACVVVDSLDFEITDDSGQAVSMQLNPLLYQQTNNMVVSTSAFEACFIVKLSALGVVAYKLLPGKQFKRTEAVLHANFDTKSKDFITRPLSSDETFSVKGHEWQTSFGAKDGTLKVIAGGGNGGGICYNFHGQPTVLKSVLTGKEHKIAIDFVKYGTVSASDKSGAYLFLPDGPAEPLPVVGREIVLIDGPLFADVTVRTNQIMHTVRVLKVPVFQSQSILINNLVDITHEFNFELAMQFKTDIENGDEFFTDLNGFQMIKRKTFKKLPLQANIYPMPIAGYVEDPSQRLTIVSGQPLGVGAHSPGVLEIMLDRRLNQDDNRGLQQGVTDNRKTQSCFALLLESRTGAAKESVKMGQFSHLAHMSSLFLLHRPFVQYQKEPQEQLALTSKFAPLKTAFPCDVHLLNLRTIQAAGEYTHSTVTPKPLKEHAMILHRFSVDCSTSTKSTAACVPSSGQLLFSHVFSDINVGSVEETSLTLLHNIRKRDIQEPLQLKPMDVKTFRITLH